jgi:hypothetical protein
MAAEIINLDAFRKIKENKLAPTKQDNPVKKMKKDEDVLADLMAALEESREILNRAGLQEKMPILKIDPDKMKLMYEVVSSIDQINERSQTYIDAKNSLQGMTLDDIAQIINKANPLFIKQKPIYFICAFRKILNSFGVKSPT